MEARKYVIEEPEPMVLGESGTAYGFMRKARTDRSELITLDEFHEHCMRRIDEIYG